MAVFLSLLFAASLGAQELTEPQNSPEGQSFSERLTWSFNGSILFFPEDNGNEGDPAPVLPSAGVNLAYHIDGRYYVELTEDLYFTDYAWSVKLERAVPAAIENRSAFVFGFLTGIQAIVKFPVNDTWSFRVFGGPAFDFRVIALNTHHPDDFGGGLAHDAQLQTDAIFDYFWGKGRWLLPVVGGGADFSINEGFLLGLDLRVWIPMYKMWSGEELPAIEGWRFGASLRITLR
jgi:hypothetical protein